MKLRLLPLVPALLAFHASAQLPSSPMASATPAAPIRVACVGDSITAGLGSAPGIPYPGQLQQLLGDQWNVQNFGVSGRTLLRKGDFPYWNEKAYQNAKAFNPNIVVIMLGTNDTKPQNWKYHSNFLTDYRALVKSFLSLPSKPKVFICRPCPVKGHGNWGISESNVRKEIPLIDQLAKELNLGVIDMHAAVSEKYLPDNVHPNSDGAAQMAAAVYKAITGKTAPAPAQ
jgi:acyl-CoA thioesterase I